MKLLTVFLTGLQAMIIFSSAASAAPVATCGNPSWIDEAVILDGIFIGNLEGMCDITGVQNGNVSKLYQYYLSQESLNVVAINSAPVAETSLAATGTIADLSVSMNDGTMRSIIKIATDETNSVFYTSESKEINFSGTAGYLRKLNLDIRIDKVSDDHFKVTLKNLTNIKKPALLPNFVFLGPAKSQSIQKFNASLSQLGKDIASALE